MSWVVVAVVVMGRLSDAVSSDSKKFKCKKFSAFLKYILPFLFSLIITIELVAKLKRADVNINNQQRVNNTREICIRQIFIYIARIAVNNTINRAVGISNNETFCVKWNNGNNLSFDGILFFFIWHSSLFISLHWSCCVDIREDKDSGKNDNKKSSFVILSDKINRPDDFWSESILFIFDENVYVSCKIEWYNVINV